jgi:OOP family OmpA-OmpF porin
LHEYVGLRVEARQILSATEALQNAGSSHVQVLAGLTITVGRKPPKEKPKPPYVDPDRDKDGILNEVDDCPDELGVAPHGCPDTDGDSFRDSVDKCPEVPGVAPDGCPVKDTDKDGFLDPDDDCPFEPETKNDYKDHDGCPDEVPPPIKKFTGAIEGIVFDFKKDTIKPESRPVLDEAVKVLKEFPDVRINIVGHTDDIGTPEFNLDLSRRRAAAVKKYLVDKGIDESRITTDGKGATDPVVPNTSEANRAKNRRIEFEIVSRGPDESTPADGAPKKKD